jgi:predicted Rossmann-fold nucleotide-binding protein
LWLLFHAKAIIVFPGGFGTLDELFEALTLIQTNKLATHELPVLLYDSGFWNDLINFQKFVDMGMISPEDLNLFHFFNSIEEGLDILKPKLRNVIKVVSNTL